MSQKAFREKLLQIMDAKDHWGWRQIVGPRMQKRQLLIHFQQEYEVFVRDFPVFLARVMGRMTTGYLQLKREFSENIYEEQTGGLSSSISRHQSHPELFLQMMTGLGFKRNLFDKISLLPTSLAYRSYLDLITLNSDWRIGAAVLTLFVEGSVEDRQRLKKNYKPTMSLKNKIRSHSLYKYHGLKESAMTLVKAHHAIEGSHRKSAWETTLQMIPKNLEDEVVTAMQNSLDLWQLYRDGICIEMNLMHPDFDRIAHSL